MGNEVEAGAECVCNHLQRPDHPDRQLTDAEVRSAVNQTVPECVQTVNSRAVSAELRPGPGGGGRRGVSTRLWGMPSAMEMELDRELRRAKELQRVARAACDLAAECQQAAKAVRA